DAQDMFPRAGGSRRSLQVFAAVCGARCDKPPCGMRSRRLNAGKHRLREECDVLINREGWLEHPDFIRIDGVADKMYSQSNSGEGGLACHSIVGEEADSEDGVPNRFLSRERTSDGSYTPYAAASCMFILRKRARLIQMYPVTASTWTTGAREANTATWAIEAEGGRPGNEGEPTRRSETDGSRGIPPAWKERIGRT